MTDAAITTRGLMKSYGKVQALRGLDLEVHRGEIFGFLGPNGAGKTTTIRLIAIAGILFKQRGIRVGGEGSWNLVRKRSARGA